MNWTDPRFAQVARILFERSGLHFPARRIPFAESAIRAAMAAVSEPDVPRYIARLQTDPQCMDALLAEANVHETYFFREPAQFEAIRDVILPQLLRSKAPDAPISLWSAGCASGEEAYSLAIALDEAGIGKRAHILATDVSRASIEAAEAGSYTAWSFRGTADDRRERWFATSRDRWTIAPLLRSRVRFAVHNLARRSNGAQPANIDLILCRNVLIYLDPATVEHVTRALIAALAPGGWLLLGSSDPLLPADGAVQHVTTPAGIAYRRCAPIVAATSSSPPARRRAAVPRVTVPVARASRAQEGRGGNSQALVHVRAMLQRGAREDATSAAAVAALGNPLEVELHVMLAMLLLELGRPRESAEAARRALYLDRSLAVVHLTLGRALRLSGRLDAARRAQLRCRNLLAAQPHDEPVRFGDGASRESLAASSAAELRLLEIEVR